jgi:hypothetical protein
MRTKVHNVLQIVGRDVPDPGAHLYHAADGVADGGRYTGKDTHRIRKALHKLRLRATGMTDDIRGSKETDGSLDNSFEAKPKE